MSRGRVLGPQEGRRAYFTRVSVPPGGAERVLYEFYESSVTPGEKTHIFYVLFLVPGEPQESPRMCALTRTWESWERKARKLRDRFPFQFLMFCYRFGVVWGSILSPKTFYVGVNLGLPAPPFAHKHRVFFSIFLQKIIKNQWVFSLLHTQKKLKCRP